jgi:hypothetical protein
MCEYIVRCRVFYPTHQAILHCNYQWPGREHKGLYHQLYMWIVHAAQQRVQAHVLLSSRDKTERCQGRCLAYSTHTGGPDANFWQGHHICHPIQQRLWCRDSQARESLPHVTGQACTGCILTMLTALLGAPRVETLRDFLVKSQSSLVCCANSNLLSSIKPNLWASSIACVCHPAVSRCRSPPPSRPQSPKTAQHQIINTAIQSIIARSSLNHKLSAPLSQSIIKTVLSSPNLVRIEHQFHFPFFLSFLSYLFDFN